MTIQKNSNTSQTKHLWFLKAIEMMQNTLFMNLKIDCISKEMKLSKAAFEKNNVVNNFIANNFDNYLSAPI